MLHRGDSSFSHVRTWHSGQGGSGATLDGMRYMHAHFGSATSLINSTLEVLLAFTFIRLGAMHMIRSRNPLVSGLGKAFLVQTG